jgi:hypothetical protein
MRLFKYCLIIGIWLLIIRCAPSARAQSATLSISPPVVEIMLAPNKKTTQTFNVQTKGSNFAIVPELHLVKPADQAGHVTVDPNPVNFTTIPLVVSSLGHPFGEAIESEDATIPITLTFEAPTIDIATDVYLALVIKTEGDESFNSSTSTGAISALILVTINPSGVIPINIEIKNFDTPLVHDSWYPISVIPSIDNKVPIMIRPEGLYEILGPTSKTAFSLPLYPNLILGNSNRLVKGRLGDKDAPLPASENSLTWTPNWRNIGPHTFRLTISTQGGTKLTQVEKTVWILPVRLSIIITTIIILMIVFLTARRNHTTVK